MAQTAHSPPAPSALTREHALLAWFRQHGSALIGFSGGVDSSYLASVAVETLGHAHVLAVIGRSASYPEEQWRAARATADQIGVRVHEIATDELSDERYASNPNNRCYFCKTELWGKLAPIARAHDLAVIVDGTNADDVQGHRPGMRAAREHGVRSPLAEVGLTKDEIRERSRARGLASWSQPSSPCLSSRVQYGLRVTPERLGQIERAERALRALGIAGDLRVRHHGELARIELSTHALDAWLAPERLRELRAAVLAEGFARVSVDLRGFRSGSLNILHGVTAA